MKLSISIIIPTANQRPKKLIRAIGSVLNQTRGDVIDNTEIIISNNSSGSLNAEVTDLVKQGFVRVIDSSEVRGVSFARNRGANNAKFDIIAFLDDDDWWEETFLIELSRAMIEKKVDLTYCGFWNWDTELNRSPGKQPDNSVTIEQLYLKNPGFRGSNFLITKDVYDQLGGFDEDLYTSNDKDFFIRFLKGNYRAHAIQRRLVNFDDTAHTRLTQPTLNKVISMRFFYDRYSADMSPETEREYRYKLHLWEAVSHRSYFGLIRLLLTYPTKRRQLLRAIRSLVRNQHVELSS